MLPGSFYESMSRKTFLFCDTLLNESLTDVLVSGDNDGDGRDEHAVFRGGTWFLNLSGGGIRTEVWGIGTDTPVPCSPLYSIEALTLKTRRKIENIAQGFYCPPSSYFRYFHKLFCQLIIEAADFNGELHFAVCAKFRLLASRGTPWHHSKILHRCDTRRHGRSGDHKRRRRRVF